jgi:hypothetical protein
VLEEGDRIQESGVRKKRQGAGCREKGRNNSLSTPMPPKLVSY